jgi:hypothetical protein
MANVHPQNQPPHEDNPLTAMLISLSGSGGPAHETGPPGANELSVRAGHEPDRFQVRSILYVPAAVVIVLVLAYLLVTWLFAMAMGGRDADLVRAKRENPLATEQNTVDWDDRAGRISSTRPKPLPVEQPAGTAQPRREGIYQTLNKTDGRPDPEFHRSKLPDPEGNNPVDIRPEDLRPENYVGYVFDPVRGEKVLARYGWADEGKKLARVPINEAIRMVAEGKLKLPVRKDPVKLPETTAERARMSNSGRGGKPPFPVPTAPSPNKDGDHKKDDKHPEKK